MTAACPFVAYYSPFTAALLEDSGWYQFDYSFATRNQWGNNKGCSFTNNLCIDPITKLSISSEFCLLNTSGCSFDGRYKGSCAVANGTPAYSAWNYFQNGTVTLGSFIDNCPNILEYSNGDCRNPVDNSNYPYFNEYYGISGRCFVGTFKLAAYVNYSGISNLGCFESHVNFLFIQIPILN